MNSPTTPRDAVPGWASNSNLASEKQIAFIQKLQEERDLSDFSQEWLKKQIANDSTLSKSKASLIIERLLTLPRKPLAQQSDPLTQIPAGRYAVENKDGELRFYQLWVARADENVRRLYVQHSDETSPLHPNVQRTIAQKILDAGIRECAIRYGLEVGECSNCGRTLTNRISRELGIGPVCGGRMFGEDGWKDEVKSKRQAIVARGEDPDEELA